MRILTNLKHLGIYPIEETITADSLLLDQQSLMSEIFTAIHDKYISEADLRDAYLYEGWSASDFIFGAIEPDTIRNAASGWNHEIKAALFSALANILNTCKMDNADTYDVDRLPLDTPETYSLKTASKELDDSWSAFSSHAVLLNNDCGWLYFRCIITDAILADITAHPADYVLVTVTPK